MSMYQIRIKPGGDWHRRKHGDPTLTACGEPVLGAVASRDWELDDHLCPKCFTRHERTTAEMKRLEREVVADHDAFEADDHEQTTDPDAENLLPELKDRPK